MRHSCLGIFLSRLVRWLPRIPRAKVAHVYCAAYLSVGGMLLTRLKVISTVSIGIILIIGLTFTIVTLASNAVGQSKTVSIVKDASNPSSIEPYNPSPLSVSVGTTVTWVNNDNTGHTVTEGNPSGNTPPNGFDSGILGPGKTFTHTFDKPGAVQYYCTLHPTMLGEIIVK